jgi:hypothetical protein
LFVQVLLIAQEAGVLKLGNVSLDGTKIHADASKSKAVSYQRLLEMLAQLRAEVEQLVALGEQTDSAELPAGLDLADEIAFREGRLVNLAAAQVVLEARAAERYQAEQAAYEAKLQARAEKKQQTGLVEDWLNDFEASEDWRATSTSKTQRPSSRFRSPLRKWRPPMIGLPVPSVIQTYHVAGGSNAPTAFSSLYLSFDFRNRILTPSPFSCTSRQSKRT